MKFSDLINSCGLADTSLEGGRFTWSGNEDGPISSRIDCFLLSIDWEDHFQGLHQIILLKITSDHFPVLLQMESPMVAERPFKFENVWLKVDGFSDFVKAVWDDFNVYGSSSFVLAKKLNFLKYKLKDLNRDVFRHLDTELGALIDKIKVFDAKEQLQSLS